MISALRLLAPALGAILLPFFPADVQAGEEISRGKILAAGPDWQSKYDQYQPDQGMLEAVKSRLGPGIRIDVYLGLWCPDSITNVPPFIKIVDKLGSGVTVRYFSLPKKADKEIKYFVKEAKVERVPTFIFYRGEREIGRIVENPKAGMLEDFMDIVFAGE